MGDERRMFAELTGDISSLTACQLQEALDEIAIGSKSFGPHEEWYNWYHYLLGELVSLRHEDFFSLLLEPLITCFFVLHPNGIHEAPYIEFESDILNTLGRCIMEPSCWQGEDIAVGRILHHPDEHKIWGWWDASGDFSASLYLCMKILPEPLVRHWFSSILAIRSSHWRAQVLVWMVGSNELLAGKLLWPSELAIDAYPSVTWQWAHYLGPELASADESGASRAEAFLPRTCRELILTLAYQYFSEDVYLEWLESFSTVPYLEAELAAIPCTFESMYVGRGAVEPRQF